MPAWGMFARHVKNLRLTEVDLRTLSPDQRPAIALNDVQGVRFSGVQLTALRDAPVWSLTKVQGMRAIDSTRLPSAPLPEAIEKSTY
jgi:hypothetical protein